MVNLCLVCTASDLNVSASCAHMPYSYPDGGGSKECRNLVDQFEMVTVLGELSQYSEQEAGIPGECYCYFSLPPPPPCLHTSLQNSMPSLTH